MAIVTIPQVSFAGGEWTPSMYGRTDQAKYATSCRRAKNLLVHRYGGISNRGGTKYICEAKGTATAVRLIPFQFNTEQSYALEFGHRYIRIIMGDGLVEKTLATTNAWTSGTAYSDSQYAKDADVIYRCLANHTAAAENRPGSGASWETYWVAQSIVEISTPYDAADLSLLDVSAPRLNYAQLADVMYLVHPSYAPRKLSRTGHDSWTLTPVAFNDGLAATTLYSNGDPSKASYGNYVVTAYDDDSESPISNVIAGRNHASNTWSLFWWDAVTDATGYKIYKENASATNWDLVHTTTSTSVSMSALGSPNTSSHPSNDNPFPGEDDYPGTCFFYDQRLWYARTNNDPQTLWGSKIGDFENFTTGENIEADDPCEFTVSDNQVNEIRGIAGINNLLLFTSGSEFKVGATSGGTITPTDVQVRFQTGNGSSYLTPVVIGNAILYVQAGGTVVRDMAYRLDNDIYDGDERSLFATHLLNDYHIIDWAYQRLPDSILWIVRSDGKLLSLTYDKNQDVCGWAQHETDGLVESVVCLRTGTGFDDVYLVVKRIIDGMVCRYIERMRPRLPDSDVEQAYFVDCGLTLDSPVTITAISQASPAIVTAAAHGFSNGQRIDIRLDLPEYLVKGGLGMSELLTVDGNPVPFRSCVAQAVTADTFALYDLAGKPIDAAGFGAYIEGGTARRAVTALSGLNHLEGKKLAVLANGNVVSGLTVAGGAVTLPYPASIIHAGLPYGWELETHEFNVTSDSGIMQDHYRAITEATLRLENTREFWLGPTWDNLSEAPMRGAENYGSPIAMFTGDKFKQTLNSSSGQSARLCLKGDDPVPFTLLAMYPRVAYGN